MKKSSTVGVRNPLLLFLFILGLMAALVFLPTQFRSEAGGKTNKGLFQQTKSHEEGIENYDIRSDKAAFEKIEGFRQSLNKDAAVVADIRADFVRGEDELRTRIPTVKVEYNSDIRTPEVITPDVWKATIEWLTPASSAKRSEILRNFVKENSSLIGVNDIQADKLRVAADYTNPDGNLSYAHLEQFINNIPVFRGEVKAGFTKDGRVIRVINNLAPGLDYESLSTDFRNPADAVKSAAGYINYELKSTDVTRNDAASNDLKTVFGTGDWATTAEKMYFPTEPGVAVPAWRVLIWQPVNAYYVIVDAARGTMLWRKNITSDQTQSATFNVYPNSNSLIDVAESPAPITPGPIDPSLGTQGVQTARANRTLIGNEGVLSFNNLGWITDGTNGTDGFTDGNAVQAGLDIDGVNGVDAPVNGTGRVFNFAYNPPPGMPPPPDDITTVGSRSGAVTQLFYINNRYHDIMYQLGFTEAARNFQNDNFGRGGVAADRVSAEAQDSSGTNNANFATPADGGRGRMQMFRFTQVPNRDGDLDGDVVIHEHTHGLSNRLIGNGSGLTTNRAGSMGEGWSDFYAVALESEPSDPINGIYTTGAYVTFQVLGLGTTNSYYGIRRFPYAVIAFTGGPLNRPHNPMTFGNVNTGNCSAFMGAFAPGFASASCTEVHNAGEIWATALWEVRARFVTRLGWATGNRRILQIVTDGMKLSPVNPTMIQERDSIITAAAALPLAPEASTDVADVREGFRIRGFGFSATDNGTTAVEAFDIANVQTVAPFSVSDSTGDNDGFPEPGENVLLSVAVTNATGATVNSVFANVNGGPNVSYGNIADGATVTMNIPYTVPGGSACGSLHMVQINVSSAIGMQAPVNRTFRLGVPVGGAPVTFTSSTALTIPNSGVSVPYGTTIAVSGLTGNKLMKLEITGITHTNPADLDFLLVGPGGTTKYIGLSDSGGAGGVSNLTFTLSDAAAAQPSTTQWVAGDFRPYNTSVFGTGDAFPAPAPAAPYTNAAPAGTDTLTSVFGIASAGLNGTWTLYLVDDAGGDFGTMAGWKLTFEANDYACSLGPTARPRADFDGDGKTDLSVFRSGTWYIQRSTAGFIGVGFGLGTDMITPGDYDGDGKADIAVFRTNTWYILKSSDGLVLTVAWGTSGDLPRAADYDGDGKTDVAVYRPSINTFFVRRSSDLALAAQNWGIAGDVPLVDDFDGDNKADYGVFRSGTWHILRSTAGYFATPFGLAGDRLVPADYDGDNNADIAVFRSGTWYLLRSTAGFATIPWGLGTDTTAPGDYDGDGKDDVAVFRGSTGTWHVLGSTSGYVATPFGTSGDVAVPTGYIP